MTKNILVTGGAGFIGSHVSKMLFLKGYHPIILDNLTIGNRSAISNGTFVEGDISNTNILKTIFSEYPVAGVMHFAAFIDVGESVLDPMKYYRNNAINSIILLEEMRKHKINNFIFSSSAAVYGVPIQEKIDETHPCIPINPYGETKLVFERILNDCSKAYGLKFVSLRYFNAAGGDPNGELKNYKTKESNLIPLVLRSLKEPNSAITINGTDYPTPDGTCIRDYIHVNDLGDAHILALEKLWQGGKPEIYNLGNGKGFSVKEVISAVERVTGMNVQKIEGPRRPGDPAVLIANSEKAYRELGWKPKYADLDVIIDHAWRAL